MKTNHAVSFAAIILALTWAGPLGASRRVVLVVAVQRLRKLKARERAAALLAVVRVCRACRS